jgi:flavin reductase (DIM6/NTAB) family NADH-FMN oxidoreductase RutF
MREDGRSMVDAATFRKTMRHLASGVFVITTRLDDRLHAMTATAFLPLSAEPALVLVCIHRDSDTHRALTQAARFGVNLLSQSQAALSRRFASKTLERYRFDDVPRFLGPGGVTFLKGSAAHVEVQTESSTAGGDHTIFIGRVTWAQSDPKFAPLVYHQGSHHGLASLADLDETFQGRAVHRT